MRDLENLNRIGIASIVFGGFLLVLYAAFAYFTVWHGEVLPYIDGPTTPTFLYALTPAAALTTPRALIWLVCGVLFLANGLYLLSFARKQSLRENREFVLTTLLSDEERMVFEELKKEGGTATQRELCRALGLSAVKMHRIVARLEQKKIVRSHPFGITKKIVLER